MEHSIMNSDGLSALVSQLGCEFDGTFIVTDETPDALDEIQRMVFSENSYYRSTRRNLALLNVIEKSLVPLILYVCEDDEEDEEEEEDTFLTADEKKSIYSKAVNLLMSLTLPLECLNSAVERYHIPHIQEKVREDVSKLYCAAKHAFLNFRLCNAILHTCKKLIQPLQEGKILETSSCQALNFTILLLRNILFLPDTQRSVNEPDSHIAILRLLFKSGLSDLILDLLASKQHQYWCVTLVQLISLLYKDQKYVAKEFVYDDTSPCVHTIGSGATVCSEGSFWWCANDTCSENTDTSLTKEDKASDELSNESTLKENDSQDDSKDGSGNSQDGNSQDSTLNGVCPPHNSEDSIEHPYGAASTEAVQAMTERLLNLERSVNCKLVYWQVNEELLSFTEALLHRGFSNLVISLKTLLITNESNGLSSLYFTWIIAHFLRLARQIKAPFSVLRICLSVDIVGYLAYLGVSSAEEIIVNHGRNLDVKHPSRSNHLVVRALYEVLLIIRYIDHKKLTNEERHVFRALTGHLIRVKDLRQLFLLFIGHLSPDIVSVQHLADVACTNHQFLIVAESVLSWENSPPFNMLSHVKSFATAEIMDQYGKLLERYEENSHEVNECVLTLMHHIAGDCDKHETLLQFSIIRKMAEIANYSSLSAESKDLVHFLMQRFIALANTDPFQCSQYMFIGASEAEDEPDANEDWKEEETDELFQLHAEYSGRDNMLDSIVEGLQVNNIFKTKQQIIVKLYAQGLLAQEEIDCLSGVEMGDSKMEADIDGTKMQAKPTGSISESVERLKKQEFHDHLTWLQDLLLELCFIKLGGRSLSNCEIAEDPVPLYYAIQGKSVPFVAYTREQEDFLRNEDFLQLLQLMGFHLAEDSGQYFPRVPHFWNPEDLMFKAQQLGPVDMEQQKFTMKDVEANANWWSNHMTPQATNVTNIDYDEKMDDQENQPGDLWHIFVRQCNIRPHLQNLKYKVEAT